MAGMMFCTPRIIDAFYHEQMGVVLICNVTTVIDGAASVQVGEPFLLQTPCDGDPEYLELVAAHLQEYWVDGDKPGFSAN